ncbi:MAG: branched-chain amino acid aminotransferase [Planctomycetota bacterium]|nr:branched-chain amino acid aminotransferase [Planctomycetota bacterium]
MQLLKTLWHNDAGFIISAELVLIASIAVLSLVVGLTEVSYGINNELEDVGSAFGSVNQSYRYNGVAGHKGKAWGSAFWDYRDDCDGECDISCDRSYPQPEDPKGPHNGR